MSALSGSYGWTDTLKSVQYGPGCAVTALPKLMHTLGVRKGLIVTGRSLYTKVFPSEAQGAPHTPTDRRRRQD